MLCQYLEDGFGLRKMDKRLSSPIHLLKKYFHFSNKEKYICRLPKTLIVDKLRCANVD